MLQYYERGTVAHLQRRTLNRQSSLQMQQARHFAALPHAMRQGKWLLHNTVITIAGRVLHMDTPTKDAPTLVCQHLQQVAANAPLQQPPPAAALHPAAAPTACNKPFCFFQKTILLQRKIQGRSRSCCTMPTPPPLSQPAPAGGSCAAMRTTILLQKRSKAAAAAAAIAAARLPRHLQLPTRQRQPAAAALLLAAVLMAAAPLPAAAHTPPG